MMKTWRMSLLGTLAAVAAMEGGTGSAADDPLARHRWTSRVLIIAAPDASNASYTKQRTALTLAATECAERDLVTVEAVGRSAEADALRRRFKLAEDDFRVILVGKDGGLKLSSDEPILPRTLFSTIDAMPMRQDEMRRR